MMRKDFPKLFGFSLVRIAIAALVGGAFVCEPVVLPSQAVAKEKQREKASDDEKDSSDKKKSKRDEKKKGKEEKDGKDKNKSEPLGTFGDWGAFATPGKDKTCYALAAPKERQPKAKLKDTPAYVFISTRPSEGVRNEVAINLGYATKDNSAAIADVDGDMFELVTKDLNAWVKNPAKEKEFVESLKGGAKLVVKAASAKGTSTTDSYSLKGLSEALARVQQECK